MKSLLVLFLLSVSFGLFAQTQMNTTINLQPGTTYYKYTGNASDTIKRVADSVYIEVINGLDTEYNISVGSKFDLVNAADTTVQISIWGKNFAGESYTMLNGTTSSNITANNTTVSSAYTAAAAKYRYVKVSYRIRATPKSSGVKIDQIELKFWKK